MCLRLELLVWDAYYPRVRILLILKFGVEPESLALIPPFVSFYLGSVMAVSINITQLEPSESVSEVGITLK